MQAVLQVEIELYVFKHMYTLTLCAVLTLTWLVVGRRKRRRSYADVLSVLAALVSHMLCHCNPNAVM